MRQQLHHTFGPLYDSHSEVLILGSFPSVKSREASFYYGHPQNRFWRIVRCLENPDLVREKKLALPDMQNTEGVETFFAENKEAVELLHCFEEKKGNPANDDFFKVRIALALRNHLALWDTIGSCTIEGSSDSSIRDVVPNDITGILKNAPIRMIGCNGGTSYQLFMKYIMPALKADPELSGHLPEVLRLPSTSPANAAWSLPRLWEKWKVIHMLRVPEQ